MLIKNVKGTVREECLLTSTSDEALIVVFENAVNDGKEDILAAPVTFDQEMFYKLKDGDNVICDILTPDTDARTNIVRLDRI